MAGRPTKLTKELLAEYAEILPQCLYLETAADLVGVRRQTVRNWLRRAARALQQAAKTSSPIPASEQLFVEFHQMHKRALAEGERVAVNQLRQAGEKSWNAAAWLLERRYPQHWSTKAQIDLTARVADQSAEDLAQRIREHPEVVVTLHAALGQIAASQSPTRQLGCQQRVAQEGSLGQLPGPHQSSDAGVSGQRGQVAGTQAPSAAGDQTG